MESLSAAIPKIDVRPSAHKSVVRNSLFMLGQNAFVTVASLFITAVIARHLGKTEFGIFNYSFSFVSLFFVFSALGLRSVTVRSVAQKREGLPKYLGLIFSLRFILGVITT